MFFIVQWKPCISSFNQEKSFLTEFDLIWFSHTGHGFLLLWVVYIFNLMPNFSPFSKTKKAYANHVQELEEVVGHIRDWQ